MAGQGGGRRDGAVVTSRRRQHELLKSWPTWALTQILRDPAEVARVRESGWSGTHHTDPTTGERIVGTPEGLGFGVDESWHNPGEVIAWSDVEAIATTVPAEIRDQLVEFRARWRAHRSAYPRFAASAAAVGCGPTIPGHPLTPRQETYVREYEAFEASGALPVWEQRRAALDDERLELHDRALGADADGEAGDLLELLEDQQLGQSVVITASPGAAEQAAAGRRLALPPLTPRPTTQPELHQAPATVRPGVAR